MTCAGHIDDGVDGGLQKVVVDGDLQCHLAEHVGGIGQASKDSRTILSLGELLGIADGEPGDADPRQGFLHGAKTGRLNHRDNHLHGWTRT